MSDIQKLTPFKFFALTNFPFIEADFDALTNYQLMCKIAEYINEIADRQNETIDAFNDLETDFTQLQSAWSAYQAVIDYKIAQFQAWFDNLDVQDEINEKLDQMAQDGTLSDLVEPFIPSVVTAWLNEHITQPTNPVVDSSLTISGAAADAQVTGNRITEVNEALDRSLYSDLTEYQQGQINSAGAEVATNMFVRTDFIPIDEFYQIIKPSGIIASINYYDTDKTFIRTSTYASTQNVNYKYEDYNFDGAAYIRFSARIDGADTTTISDLLNAGFKVVLQFNDGINREKLNKVIEITNKIEKTDPVNVLNPEELLPQTQIFASGATSENTAYATTGFIPVSLGDEIVVTMNPNLPITISRLVTYTENKNVISGGVTNVQSYVVTSDAVKYVRFCANNTYMNYWGTRINKDGIRHNYTPFNSDDVDKTTGENADQIFLLEHYPLTTLPEYILNNLAYKPLGCLSKPYICIVSDDGNALVETYTIPMFISKDVPCTLAMMSTSGVLQTQSGINAVLDAVNNHGFCVAQHGGSYWTPNFNEYALNKFFDDELTYWQSIGITPYGACAPGHQVNNWIRALAGGRFGCHRAAYFDGVPWYGGSYYINGPRSNMYSLTSQNIIEGTIETWQDKCDLTKENNWLMMIHMHENTLTETSKAQLEAVIDYAKQIELNFVTMKDIPTLI